MVAQSLIDHVFALPEEDRLELLDRLRDSLQGNPAITPLTASERDLLDQRLSDLQANPTAESDWTDVKKRIAAALDQA